MNLIFFDLPCNKLIKHALAITFLHDMQMSVYNHTPKFITAFVGSMLETFCPFVRRATFVFCGVNSSLFSSSRLSSANAITLTPSGTSNLKSLQQKTFQKLGPYHTVSYGIRGICREKVITKHSVVSLVNAGLRTQQAVRFITLRYSCPKTSLSILFHRSFQHLLLDFVNTAVEVHLLSSYASQSLFCTCSRLFLFLFI